MTYTVDELIFDKCILENEIQNLIKEFETKYHVMKITKVVLNELPSYGDKKYNISVLIEIN